MRWWKRLSKRRTRPWSGRSGESRATVAAIQPFARNSPTGCCVLCVQLLFDGPGFLAPCRSKAPWASKADAALCTRAAAAMVTLKMKSDELARFLTHTIASNGHSTEAIAETFALRDPAVLQRLMFRVLETDRKCRRRVLEVIDKLAVTDLTTQLPTLLQVLPEPQVGSLEPAPRAYSTHSSAGCPGWWNVLSPGN